MLFAKALADGKQGRWIHSWTQPVTSLLSAGHKQNLSPPRALHNLATYIPGHLASLQHTADQRSVSETINIYLSLLSFHAVTDV